MLNALLYIYIHKANTFLLITILNYFTYIKKVINAIMIIINNNIFNEHI